MSLNLPLLFFLLLAPLGGLIAWIGDRIGHKIGKRRHSLFGLRPRHTATLFTVGSGVGIALFTFGLMWASNATFRDVMSRGSELLAANHDLTRSNQSLETLVAQRRLVVEESKRQAHEARQDALGALTAKQDAEAKYRAAQTTLENARTALKRAETTLATTKGDLTGARARLAAATQSVQSARREEQAARADMRQSQQAARVAQNTQNQVVSRASRLVRDLVRSQRDEQKRLEALVAEQRSAQAKLRQQNLLLADQIAANEKKRLELARVALQIDEDSAKLQRLLGQSLTSASALRQKQITYRVGEELDRATIPSGLSIWRIRAVLDGLLGSAGKKAELRGASRTEGVGRAVAILPRAVTSENGKNGDTPGGGDQTSRLAGETDALAAAADAIRLANEDVVVVVAASANAVTGEPVSVDLRTFRNPVVLAYGVKVGETTLDGSKSGQAIADTFYNFLRQDVRKKLLDSGVIPPLTGENSGDDDANAGSVVSLSGDEYFQIMDRVRKAGPRARVTVRAARDLRAADPVSLTFEVKGSPANTAATSARAEL